MSRTRHAEADAPLSQERYMSSPEYAALRGLSGTAVSAKAALVNDPRASSLLFLLQALSLRSGGLKKVKDDVLAMFPERIGTPLMHKFGMKPGQIYTAEQVRRARCEVERGTPFDPDFQPHSAAFPLKGEFKEAPLRLAVPGDSVASMLDEEQAALDAAREAENRKSQADAQKHPVSYPAAVLVEACRKAAGGAMEKFLVELCINPAVRIPMPGAVAGELAAQQCNAQEQFPELGSDRFRDAGLFHFRDIIGALMEFKARHEQAARGQFAETVVSKSIFRTLARGLSSRKIVVVNGVEGIGKSFSAEAWCEQHLGEARFVRLEGIVNRTTFFQAVSKALGLAASVHQKSSEMQVRVRHHLERSGIMLVIDEAHRCFPQAERIYSHPELLNWIYTLWDIRVPCALLVTPQFVTRMDEVERQTDWRSGQFKRRVECWTNLPVKLGEEDLRAVARSRAPAYTVRMIDELVDFALPARRQIDAMARAISAAEFIASEQGRARPTERDLAAGIEEAQATDLALTTKGDLERQRKGAAAGSRRRHGRAAAELPPDTGSDDAAPLPGDGDANLTDTTTPLRGITPRPAFAATV